MSRALKCDRCHNYYDPFDYKMVIFTDGPILSARNKHVDLCPSCQEKLEKWVHEYEFFDSVCEETEDVPETE